MSLLDADDHSSYNSQFSLVGGTNQNIYTQTPQEPGSWSSSMSNWRKFCAATIEIAYQISIWRVTANAVSSIKWPVTLISTTTTKTITHLVAFQPGNPSQLAPAKTFFEVYFLHLLWPESLFHNLSPGFLLPRGLTLTPSWQLVYFQPIILVLCPHHLNLFRCSNVITSTSSVPRLAVNSLRVNLKH